ncbi:hypothetical protein CDD82_6753 [Ophiocordyceps australis]|uniref:Cytochrome P450 monooxygenase n=1 Tax=Ophiocordyceps australis TaxID=1399860 RepID=A0A2C5ZJM6_9HYPO|nr:hypothetical protein CDD82_6753 [Ophiocordyceps australis]
MPQFYLKGQDPSTAIDIDVPPSSSLDDIQALVATQYTIVVPEGIGFAIDGNKTTVPSDITAAKGPVGITIDDQDIKDIPGPKGIPYFGNYLEIYPDHLGNNERLFQKYGPLFVVNNMDARLYLTNDPKYATIFLAENGYFGKLLIPGHPLYPIKLPEAGVFLGDSNTEAWRQAHKFLPPALGPKAARHYAPQMQKTIESAFKVFDQLAQQDEAWNVYQYMLKAGSQAVGKLVLGMDFDHFKSVDTPLDEMISLIAENLQLIKRVSLAGEWYSKLPFGDPKRLRDTKVRIRQLVMTSVESARKGEADLELQEAALSSENVIDYCLRAKDSKGNKLPVDQFVEALCVTTGAGFTTTSSLLSWCIFVMVKYPEMQQRLLQELVDFGWTHDTQATAELTNSMPFLDKLIKETQRCHNPAYQPARTSMVDMILPGGYKLPKDSVVVSSIHHLHNNEKYWDNPLRFDPDRWDTEAVKKRPTGLYMPFAIGPRSCIGFNFALQEVKVFLPKLVYRYKFTLAQNGPLEYDPYFQLIRPNNLYVRAEQRVKWPPKSE